VVDLLLITFIWSFVRRDIPSVGRCATVERCIAEIPVSRRNKSRSTMLSSPSHRDGSEQELVIAIRTEGRR